MSSGEDDKTDGDDFDVVVVHGSTGDGEGARVLRARPGHIEAGEVRPVRDGQPLTPGGEVVRLVERTGAPCVYDVKVDYQVPSQVPGATAAPSPAARSAGGPPQVSTKAYRESWDRTFAPARRHLN